jgi:hypothetical protein
MFRIAKLTQKSFNSRKAVLAAFWPIYKDRSAKPSKTASPELQNI